MSDLYVLMTPHIDDFKTHESGIRRVIEAYFRYLPDFEINLVKSDQPYDLRAVHAGMTGRDCEISHLHGAYWTADYAASSWEYHANELIVQSLRNALEVTVPSSWVAETLQRDMRFSPHVVPHGIEWTEWTPEKHEGYVLWNKNRGGVDVCDPTPAIELARLRSNIELVTTFLPFGMTEKLPNVRGIGLVKHNVMKKYIQRAMVYLSTTKETFGIGTLEAMASGIPVLGFDWGGNRGLVEHGVNGYLARVNDIGDLAEGLDYCIRYRDTLGDNGREMAKLWNWPDAVRQIADIYKLAMQSDPGQGKVSVVIPCYNYAHILERAVKSVQEQTLQPDRIIIVNDGSTDNTDDVGRRLAEQFPNIYYISQENAGVAIARNTGIAACTSEYICCMDADDQIAPKFLEACVVALDGDRSLGIAYTGLEMLREGGKKAMSDWPTQPDYDKQLLARSATDLKGANQVPTCNVFRREAWVRTGGYKQRYAPLGAGAEDGEFWARIMSIGYGARKVSESGLFIYSMDGRVSTPFADGSIDKKLLEPDWLAMHPWATDGQHPFASRATPTKQSHAVRQYDQPDVSVIIPVGPGHEKIVENALDSLEAQTFRRWEVIVVWDAGGQYGTKIEATDNYGEGVQLHMPKKWQELKLSYPYIHGWHTGKGNKGAGYARNRGAEIARAPFFVFLDADDSLAPTFLERCIENWRANKTIAYTDYISKAIVPEESLADWKPEDILSYLPQKQEALIAGRAKEFDCERAQMQPMDRDFFHWCLVTAFIPKSWHDKIGGFDEDMETFEDVLYHWAMARHGFCYTRISEPLVIYRMYTGNRREIASLYTDEGRQKARNMLEYAREVLERIDIVACKKCPGSQPKARVNVYREMNNYNEKEAAKMADSDMIMAELTTGNIGNRHIVGAATGTRYGYRGDGGGSFLVHRLDIEAQPHMFRAVQESVPAPIEPTTPPAPPSSVIEQGAIMSDIIKEGIPEYIAPAAPEDDSEMLASAIQAEALAPIEPASEELFVGALGDLTPEAVVTSLPPETKLEHANTYIPPTIAAADEEIDLEGIPGISTPIARELRTRGLTTKRKIGAIGTDGLMKIPGVGPTRAEAIMTALAIDARTMS